MTIIELIGLILGLVSKVLGEYFEAKKRARLKKEEFELNEKKFIEMVDKAIIKMREDAKIENKKVKTVEDLLDEELRKK